MKKPPFWYLENGGKTPAERTRQRRAWTGWGNQSVVFYHISTEVVKSGFALHTESKFGLFVGADEDIGPYEINMKTKT
jgi:hypothetical protein